MIDKGLQALVLAHNSGGELRRCVDRLLAIFPGGNILVGDNASTDHCAEDLSDSVSVITFPGNIGYCAGMNRLMETALHRGARRVLSLNPDVSIEAKDVEALARALADEDAAMAHPRILRAGSPGILDGAYGELTWRHLAVRMLGEGARDGGIWREARDVLCGHGACFMAKPDVLQRVGGFDESFFAYQEEAELGLRLLRAGYRVRYVPEAKVLHEGPWDNAAKMETKSYFLARNSVLLTRKHGGPLQKLKFRFFLLACGLPLYGARALLGSPNARASLRGWWDGLRAGRNRLSPGVFR